MMGNPVRFLNCVLFVLSALFVGRTGYSQIIVNGSVVESSESAFLKGAGWYNFYTAKADEAYVNSMIRWKEDMRKDDQIYRDLQDRKKAAKNLKEEERLRQIAQRAYKLRTSPTAVDVESGEALNALLYDLTDPTLTFDQWYANKVALPRQLSVKDLIFQFVPSSKESATSLALGKGVIALARLDIKDKWPAAMNVSSLKDEEDAYEAAYAKVLEEVFSGKMSPDAIKAMDKALADLKSEVGKLPKDDRGFSAGAKKFVEDLINATKMFDASTVDYAKEMLIDTQEHDAQNVAELVAFMVKYRLRFASADGNPKARTLYRELYGAMSSQGNKLGVVPKTPGGDESKHPLPQPTPVKKDSLVKKDSVWTGNDNGRSLRLTVKEKSDDAFKATFEIGDKIVREVNGTVKGDELSWLTKDVQSVKGNPGGDNFGKVVGNRIDFKWNDASGKSGTFSLHLSK